MQSRRTSGGKARQARPRQCRAAPLPVVLLACTALVPPALAQSFQPVGNGGPASGGTPWSSVRPSGTYTSERPSPMPDGSPGGTTSAAVQVLSIDPRDPNTILAGTPNGGIWRTTDGGTTWQPLTDQFRSLSIAALARDPTNPAHVAAGLGWTSNGAIGPAFFRGGLEGGLLLSGNGGESWRQLTLPQLGNLGVTDLLVRGDTVLAASAGYNSHRGGLFRISASTGEMAPVILPGSEAGAAVNALAGDPRNPDRIFAAALAGTASPAAVYRSDTGGATWTLLASAGDGSPLGTALAGSQRVKLASGAGGSLAALVVQDRAASAVLLSQDSGATWRPLSLSAIARDITPGGQGVLNSAIALDPNQPNTVYLIGDRVRDTREGNPDFDRYNAYYLPVFRLTLNPDGSTAVQSLAGPGLASETFVHADGRSILFAPDGRMLVTNDGGIYALSSTDPAKGAWRGLNGTLQIGEFYSIAYDSRTGRLAAAAQDAGIGLQAGRNGAPFAIFSGADGLNVQINDRLPGHSLLYSSVQSLGALTRWVIDPAAPGGLRDPVLLNPIGSDGPMRVGNPQEEDEDEDEEEDRVPFSSSIVLNRLEPTRLAFGTREVGWGTDVPGAISRPGHGEQPPSYDLPLTHVGALGPEDRDSEITALAFGVRDAPLALLAGGSYRGAPVLALSTTGAEDSLTPLPAYAAASGQAPSSVVFDARTVARFFAADQRDLWGTRDTGRSFQSLTANLPAGFIRPTALEFISANGVNALLVGGLNNAANLGNPLVVADSDAEGLLSGWRRFGTGLPNANINLLTYNDRADVLAVSSYGRGAFLLYDVTSYFPQALELAFGRADNDSAPEAARLFGDRPLVKYGTGTLLLPDGGTWTGGTVLNAGTVVAGSDSAFGAAGTRIAFAGPAVLQLSGAFASPRPVALDASGILDVRAPVTWSGPISGPGGLTVTGGNVLTLLGANSHAGGTLVTGGSTLAIAADAALGAANATLTLSNGRLRALAAFGIGRPVVLGAAGGAFDLNGFDLALNGPLTLGGPLTQTGAGHLLLNGALSGGQVAVESGTLSVNAQLTAAALQVGPEGTLRGTGTLAAPSFVAGTLAPGNSPGTLTATAPVTLGPSATLRTEIDGPGIGNGAGNYSRLLVQGAPFTAGGTILPVLRGITGSATNAYTPAVGTAFTVVQAEGGVQGSFSGLTQPAAGLPAGARFDALYFSTALNLYVTPASYARLSGLGLRQTPNEAAAGGAVDALRPAPGLRADAAITAALDPFYRLPAAAIPGALDWLGAPVYGDALLAGLERDRGFGAVVTDQVATRRGMAAPQGTALAAQWNLTAWAAGLGQNFRIGNGGQGNGWGQLSGGVAVGADLRLGAHWLAGFAVGNSSGRVTARASAGTADADMVHFAAYGGWHSGPFFATAQLGWSYADDLVRRDLGMLGGGVRGHARGWGLNGAAEAGVTLAAHGWRIEPSLGLRLDRLDRGRSQETGGGPFALSVAGDTVTALRSALGVRAETAVELGGELRLLPSLRLAWAHDLAEMGTGTDAAFAGAPGAGFRVASGRGGRDALLGEIGASLPLGARASLFARYAVELRDGFTGQAVNAGLRWSW